jgi:hypothetical protein
MGKHVGCDVTAMNLRRWVLFCKARRHNAGAHTDIKDFRSSADRTIKEFEQGLSQRTLQPGVLVIGVRMAVKGFFYKCFINGTH